MIPKEGDIFIFNILRNRTTRKEQNVTQWGPLNDV